jgi:hypothetical protein
MSRTLRPLAVLAALWLATSAAQAAPTNSFTLTGQVAAPQTYGTAALASLPQTTRTLTYLSGGTPRTDTFTGPTLWNVLQSAGGITVDATTSNGVLRNFVVVTGSDGYKAVISAGEIAPNFGNRGSQVAIAASSGTLPDPNGFARITAPGDVRGGRYVSNVANIDVGVAPLQQGTGGGPSLSLQVQGDVLATLAFDRAALQALTPYTETVSYLSGMNTVTNTFTGALLWDVLQAAGIVTDPAISNDILRKGVIATGSDGYQAMFALGEISPNFGNVPILVAYDDANGPLTGNGFARLVVPGDVRGGRYVSNLVSLTVFDATAVPEPAGLVVLLAGIGGLGLAYRRGRPGIGTRSGSRPDRIA